MPELFRIMIDNAMLVERQQYLHAEPYQRQQSAAGKPRLQTKNCNYSDRTIPFPSPSPDGSFYPQALDKGVRSERALMISLRNVCAWRFHPESTTSLKRCVERLSPLRK